MQSGYIWIIAGASGALVGAAATYYLADHPPAVESPASLHQASMPPRDQNVNIPIASVSADGAQDFAAVRRDPLPVPNTSAEPSPAVPASAVKKKTDPAEEEAMVQIVLSRLYDPTMTLPGIMQSEEMLKLSDESRERVVAKMVEMLNRGEIDARAFMPAGK